MSGIGSGISDIFGGIGDFMSAGGYRSAAHYATSNAAIEKVSGAIQENQAKRQIYQTIGGGQADAASSGLAASGSAMDVLRSSVSQGGLQKALIANQSLIQQQDWLAKAAQDEATANSQDASGIGSILSGGASLALALL